MDPRTRSATTPAAERQRRIWTEAPPPQLQIEGRWGRVRRRLDPARGSPRLGTLIRHAGRLAATILPLPIPMIEPPFPTLLMTAVGLTPLLAARLLATTRAAVTLTMITTGTQIKQQTAPFGAAELWAESNRWDRHPAAKTSLSRQTLDSRRHSCEDHLTLVERPSSTRSTDQQKTPVARTTGVCFPADPSRPVPFSKAQPSRPARSDSDDRSDDGFDDTDPLCRHSFRFRRFGMIADTQAS